MIMTKYPLQDPDMLAPAVQITADLQAPYFKDIFASCCINGYIKFY